MNIILLLPKDQIGPKRYFLSGLRANHIKEILKLNVNDTLEIGLLNGPLGKAKINKINDDGVVLELTEIFTEPVSGTNLTLICALPRPQTLKKVLSVSAAMGVNTIHFIKTNRVQKSYFQSTLIKGNNYFRYLLDGLSQGKRTRLPQVYFHKRFKEFFQEILPVYNNSSNEITLKLLAENSSENYLTGIYNNSFAKLILAIGPEGGWIPFEINYMQELGFIPFKLSESILRVESAVTAAISQLELLINGKYQSN